MTSELQSISSVKIPKKIQKVIDAYDQMLVYQRQFRAMQRVTAQPLPPWKARRLENVEAAIFVKFYSAQGIWKKLWEKLSTKDIETAIKIKREMEGIK